MFIRHVSGAKNTVADWLSRMHAYLATERGATVLSEGHAEVGCLMSCMLEYPGLREPAVRFAVKDAVCVVENPGEQQAAPGEQKVWSQSEMLSEVHGGRKLHWGARRTWQALNKRFPGHSISFRLVEDWVAKCPICQKDRLGMDTYIEPIYRHLKKEHPRRAVGVDILTVTPADDAGNTCLIVIVVFYIKYVWATPAKEYTAHTVAVALFTFFCTFGIYDELWSDPGSDLMAEVVQKLTEWMGIRRVISLVDRHESNGVEGSNKQILRHLRTLVHDLRVPKKWSDPTILSLVLFAINDGVNSETGVRPLDAMFGSEDSPYFRLPDSTDPSSITSAWVRGLDEDLRHIRAKSLAFQKELVQERCKDTPEEFQNKYQAGDFVLFQRDPSVPRPTKLTSPYTGPYEVIQQLKNDVECRHLVMGNIKVLHVTRLKLFVGTREEAYKAALLDADQFVIRRIHYWRGNPEKRSEMFFLVEFDDGDKVLLPYSKDLSSSAQFEEFIFAEPPLFPLRINAADAPKRITAMRREPIRNIALHDVIYVDLRYWGYEWFDTLDLPNAYVTTYVVACEYVAWHTHRRYRYVKVRCPLFDEVLSDLWDYYYVYIYGSISALNDTHTLVDEQFCLLYPAILPERHRDR